MIERWKYNLNYFFDKSFLTEAKKLRLSFVRRGNPPLVTHNISNESNDAIINAFEEVLEFMSGMLNALATFDAAEGGRFELPASASRKRNSTCK